ncbi:hypothetical protein AeNC1_016329 [Aphanomyces euteiches]|nr:hypothetical protein AeNC1_016329 [Aphanomyces euteiches]
MPGVAGEDLTFKRTLCMDGGPKGALSWPKTDGKAKYSSNKASAAYGTGYCDAQCPHDINSGEPNAGSGQYGSCCAEVNIYETNLISQAYTPHPCTVSRQYRCSSSTDCCDDTTSNRFYCVCDKDGCDFNTHRLNDHTFYGPGSNFNIDSTKPVTVLTQFVTDGRTDNSNSRQKRQGHQLERH